MKLTTHLYLVAELECLVYLHSDMDLVFMYKDNIIIPTERNVNGLNSSALERYTIMCIEAARVLNVCHVIHSLSYSFMFKGNFFC